jgi:HEAT repeat protein
MTGSMATSTELNALRQSLALKAQAYPRTGGLLDREELTALYRHRDQIAPKESEFVLILASMMRVDHPGLKLKHYDLGWYWFRNVTRLPLCSLLAELAKDENPVVRWPAVNALSFFPSDEAFRLLTDTIGDQTFKVAAEAVKGLARYPANRVVSLMRQVSFNQALHPHVRREAAKAVARLDVPGKSALIERLANDATPSMRQLAVELATFVPQPGVTQVLQNLIKDKSKGVRGMALVALARLARANDRVWIVERAKNDRCSNQTDAIRALGEFADHRDLPLLSTLAASERSFPVRWAVAQALRSYPCKESVCLLMGLALGMTCGPAFDSLVCLPAKLTARTIRELAIVQNATVRTNLVSRLGDWKHPGLRRILRKLVCDPDSTVRAAAVSSLGALDQVDDLPLLRRLCRDESEVVRSEAVWNVGKARLKTDIPLMKALAFDKCAAVRTLAARRLASAAARTELLQWLDANLKELSFEVLKELDYKLYAPGWLQRAEQQADDGTSLMELGIIWQDATVNRKRKSV